VVAEAQGRGDESISFSDDGRITMLSWAITFLVIALIAAVLGFGGIAGTAAGFAKILFFVFLVMFVVSLIMGRTRTPVV
jgi:uncharacterized membrane protein YtjA (UPF0391 family)